MSTCVHDVLPPQLDNNNGRVFSNLNFILVSHERLCLCVCRGRTERMEGCKHTRHAATVDSAGEGGAFRAARTTWTQDRTDGGGGSGIPSLRRRHISLRRQSPTPMPTTHSVAVDSHITHTSPTPPTSSLVGRHSGTDSGEHHLCLRCRRGTSTGGRQF